MPSKSKVDPGWLRLQRERFGPSYRYIPPNNIRTAGDLIPGLMKKMGMESETRLFEINQVWEELVGNVNAAHARPGRWEKGLLIVYVDHHLWLNEFKKTISVPLLKKIQDQFGKSSVRQLRFEMDPDL